MDDQAIALRELQALLKVKGSLKMITAEVRPALRQDRADRRSPAKAGVDLTRPDSFVLHDIVRLEPHPTKDGLYYAHTAEGDYVLGYPAALVRRLRRWRDA